MREFVVISADPRGFWHADYWAVEDGVTLEDIRLSGCAPDGFFTQRGLRPVIEHEARQRWPSATVVWAGEEIEEAE